MPYAENHDELRDRILGVEKLAALPHVVLELVRIMGQDNADAGEVAGIVETDQALTAKLLSLANSAYYGFAQRIVRVRQAVIVLGFKELQFLAVGSGLSLMFDIKQGPAEMDGEGLWLHSLATSWLSRELAQEAGYANPGDLMVAGLMHDIGKLVLVCHFPQQVAGIIREMREGRPFFEAEDICGLRHGVIGYWLATKWELPPLHAAAIRDHHSPRSGEAHYEASCLVHIADAVAKAMGIGPGHASAPLNKAELMRGAGLQGKVVARVAARAKEKLLPQLDTWKDMFRGKVRVVGQPSR